MSGGLPGSFQPLAGHYRPVRHFHEPPASSLFLPGGGSPSPGHRRHEPVLGRPPGLRLSSVRLHFECPGQDPPVSESGGHSRRPILASEAVVPGHPGTPSGCPGPSTAPQGLAPATPFSSEPPRTSHDWVSYSQRTARHLSFSSAVARQLAFCRRSSTRMNYQARWLAYRTWCRRQGHSISRPTISKIADFLLYLRRSLHFSYSSIASYRSMLSAVFRFILPDVSSHPVLHGLLRSFRIERLLSSSRVPPWDLLRVLSPPRPSVRASFHLFAAGLHPQGPLPCCVGHYSSGWGTADGIFVSFIFQGGSLPLLPPGISGEDGVSIQPSASLLCGLLAAGLCWLFPMSYSCALSGLCVSMCLVHLPSPLGHAPSLYCLVLLLVLSPRMPSAIFFGVSFSSLCFLLPPLLSGLILFALFLLPLLFRVMLRCLIFLLWLHDVRLLFLLHFTSVMYNLLQYWVCFGSCYCCGCSCSIWCWVRLFYFPFPCF